METITKLTFKIVEAGIMALAEIRGIAYEKLVSERTDDSYYLPYVGKEFDKWEFNGNFYDLRLIYDIDGGGYTRAIEFNTPAATRPTNQYFADEAKVITWNDGQGSRNRQVRLLLYTGNNVYNFTGADIPDICALVGTPSYTKNGKWSNSTYTIQLAKGVRSSAISQNWDSGRYVNNHVSLPAMAKDLGLVGVENRAVEEFLKCTLFRAWQAWQDHIAKMEELEKVADSQKSDMRSYTYTRECNAKRMGDNMLLIDGVVFNGQDSDTVKVFNVKHVSGHRGGSTTYQLMVLATALLEELPEYSPYGDGADSLQERGYILGDNGWSLDAPIAEEAIIDSPFAALTGLLKSDPTKFVDIVVSRHSGLLEYLSQEGYTWGIVLQHVVDATVLDNKHVLGVLPMHLACHCASVTEVQLDIPAEMRGKELSCDQTREFATGIFTYEVTKR